jgi:hypothetical protein
LFLLRTQSAAVAELLLGQLSRHSFIRLHLQQVRIGHTPLCGAPLVRRMRGYRRRLRRGLIRSVGACAAAAAAHATTTAAAAAVDAMAMRPVVL